MDTMLMIMCCIGFIIYFTIFMKIAGPGFRAAWFGAVGSFLKNGPGKCQGVFILLTPIIPIAVLATIYQAIFK